MRKKEKYIFNEKTLSYELEQLTPGHRVLRISIMLGVGILCFFGYFYFYSSILKLDTPKEKVLARENRILLAQLDLISQQLDVDNQKLSVIQRRDNIVYRPIFGMDEISSDVRNAGFGGIDRYEKYTIFNHGNYMAQVAMKMDILSKKTYIQSKSFDEVELLAERAGSMASSVPSINPIAPVPRNRLTSSFGFRVHPIQRRVIFHEGIDFSGPAGEPIYATGDGIVESVSRNYFGYGNSVIIDHGFGYKTRYAHLKSSLVTVGQHVSKGDQIATMGNTGMSTGNHLHYEVVYRGRRINPYNFLNMNMDIDEYIKLVRPSGTEG